jgi:hypothetical protein
MHSNFFNPENKKHLGDRDADERIILNGSQGNRLQVCDWIAII